MTKTIGLIGLLLGSLMLVSCSTYPGFIPASGPSAAQVINAPANSSRLDGQSVKVVELTDEVVKSSLSKRKMSQFGDVFGTQDTPGYLVGPGDVLEVSIWEAPPATLFGSTLGGDPRSGPATSRPSALPEQMVTQSGFINVPFAGAIPASGKSPQEIEAEIVKRLKGKANQPQVLVRITKNVTSNVTLVGEFSQNVRLPLTAKGETLLDAVAAAGGVRQPVGKITVQLNRGNRVVSMPLEAAVSDSRHNIKLRAGDVITAVYQPFSAVVLGATGASKELDFEAQGISLAQALGRVGGLQDNKADARAVFVFRYENPEYLGEPTPSDSKSRPVPTVYKVDLRDPASFFVAQYFPMQNKDILYVANSPAAELQKFLNIVGSVILPVNIINSLSPN